VKIEGGEDTLDALSSQVIFRKRALWLVAFLREKTCNGIICIFATLYVDPCSFISAHDVVLRMYLHCLLSFLFLFPRPHVNLLGVQRVSNPSTGNQCISTPAHSLWYKSKILFSAGLGVQINLKSVHGVEIPLSRSFCCAGYGVATISRMLKNICLFAEYRSLL
jgi:hypothetical protein